MVARFAFNAVDDLDLKFKHSACWHVAVFVPGARRAQLKRGADNLHDQSERVQEPIFILCIANAA